MIDLDDRISSMEEFGERLIEEEEEEEEEGIS